ncbi:MAG: hypothetical protein KAR33_10425 [Candidatus Thorarchaeota archaeon]|nr:hypothetical protein [Candidatus Thorarchaeota archaeon]
MLGAYLTITLGFQLFLIIGYLFYAIFRTYPKGDDRISLMSWVTGFFGVLTFGLVGVLLLTLTRIPVSEAIPALALSFADIIGLYLLVDDTRRQRKSIPGNN